MSSTALTRYRSNYVAKRPCSSLGNAFRLYGPDGSLAFREAEGFQLKEQITVFADEALERCHAGHPGPLGDGLLWHLRRDRRQIRREGGRAPPKASSRCFATSGRSSMPTTTPSAP